jgi:hypothetical protein
MIRCEVYGHEWYKVWEQEVLRMQMGWGPARRRVQEVFQCYRCGEMGYPC